MNYIRIGNHLCNIDKVQHISVKETLHSNILVVTITYDNGTKEEINVQRSDYEHTTPLIASDITNAIKDALSIMDYDCEDILTFAEPYRGTSF